MFFKNRSSYHFVIFNEMVAIGKEAIRKQKFYYNFFLPFLHVLSDCNTTLSITIEMPT